MNRLTASIVVYKNDLKILDDTIKSCLNSYPEMHLYVIDNSPTDEAETLCNDHRITYVFNNRNLGFGPGHNIALKKIINSSEYHIVVNPDVYFPEKVIPELLGFMDAHEDTGLIMPKVFNPDGTLQHVCKLLPKPHNLIYRRFLRFYKHFEKYDHQYEMRFTVYNQTMDVPFISGCFMFLRTEALKRVGLFDERIFLYTEDVDLSRRIHKYYRTIFYPKVGIYHYHARGSYNNLALLWHNIDSAINYFNKWGWYNDKERDEINNRILLNYVVDEH